MSGMFFLRHTVHVDFSSRPCAYCLPPANTVWSVAFVCVSVCLWCCHFWKPWSRKSFPVCSYIIRISRSSWSSYIKVTGSRSRSQEQRKCICASCSRCSGFDWTTVFSFCSQICV